MKDERRAPLGGDEVVFQLVAMDGVDKEDITTITYGLICGKYSKKKKQIIQKKAKRPHQMTLLIESAPT